MAFMDNNSSSIKIHEHCKVAPQSATEACLPLSFFDLLWLRLHPVERIFFYNLQNPQSDPSFFFHKVVPKLKTSLSLTLQHFLPLAGNVVWPSDSEKPLVKFTPGHDAVSLVIAESSADFNQILEFNTPHEAGNSRSFIPHLESTESTASVMSLQITLFPNRGFSIGISTHHAVLDGKSSTLFLKAWAYLCQSQTSEESESESESESPSLLPDLEPFFDRKIIKDREPAELGITFAKKWSEVLSKIFPDEKNIEKTLKILPFPPKVEDSVRARFLLKRGDLEKIKKRVLSMWEEFNREEESTGLVSVPPSKPQTLSSFQVTCAYVVVCMTKAIHGVEKETQKFSFAFTVDCRARLEPPVPDNYFGNCVWGQLVDTEPMDFIKEEGLFLVAKSIHDRVKKLGEEGVLEVAKEGFSKFATLASERIELITVAGSNRFGVYGIDFGWGRPCKVEITSVDRGLTIGLAESEDGKGGVEVGLVLNKHVMDLFISLFHGGLCDE